MLRWLTNRDYYRGQQESKNHLQISDSSACPPKADPNTLYIDIILRRKGENTWKDGCKLKGDGWDILQGKYKFSHYLSSSEGLIINVK